MTILFEEISDCFERFRYRKRATKELQKLSNEDLKDLGITRGEIYYVTKEASRKIKQ